MPQVILAAPNLETAMESAMADCSKSVILQRLIYTPQVLLMLEGFAVHSAGKNWELNMMHVRQLV